jgi:hypothetical protein
MVTGRGPHENVITPPAATARTTACEVQLAGVPWPITWPEWTALTAGAAGLAACLGVRGAVVALAVAARAVAAPPVRVAAGAGVAWRLRC